jgi:predicted nucleic acid-binding protein
MKVVEGFSPLTVSGEFYANRHYQVDMTLMYCYSTTDPRKQNIARALSSVENTCISTQVINETANVLSKRYNIPWNDIANLVTDFEINFIVHRLEPTEIKKACGIAATYGFSFFDSLMIASAIECDCSILYSEDMNNGQVIEGKLKIINPFL